MKVVKLMLLFATMAMAANVWAKNNTIQFDEQFKIVGTASVEPYEIVNLSGKFDPAKVLTFKIILTGAVTPQEVKVNLMDNIWTAQVGPFFPNQSVSLKFEVKSKLTESDFKNFQKQFEEAFNTSMDWIEANYSANRSAFSNSDSLFVAFAKQFKQNLPISFQSYKDKDNKPASEILLEKLDLNQKYNIFTYYRNLSILNNSKAMFTGNKIAILNCFPDTLKTEADSFLVKLENDSAGLDSTKVFEQILSPLNSKQKEKDVLFGKIKDNLKILIEEHNKIIDNEKNKANILKECDIFKTSELTCSVDNSTTLSIDIQQFIGFDIVTMAMFGANRPGSPFGVFLTVNPYFGKINPDEKIWNPKPSGDENASERKARKEENWKRFITPTVGIALVTSVDSIRPKPIVFGGVGVRINPLVRATVGVSVYTPGKETVPVACFTMGLGININYVGEVLKIFSTASSNF